MHTEMYSKKYDMIMGDFWDELKDAKTYIHQYNEMKDYCPTTATAFHTMAMARVENAKKLKTMLDNMNAEKMQAMATEHKSEEHGEHSMRCKAHYYKESPRLNEEILEVSTMLQLMKM